MGRRAGQAAEIVQPCGMTHRLFRRDFAIKRLSETASRVYGGGEQEAALRAFCCLSNPTQIRLIFDCYGNFNSSIP